MDAHWDRNRRWDWETTFMRRVGWFKLQVLGRIFLSGLLLPLFLLSNHTLSLLFPVRYIFDYLHPSSYFFHHLAYFACTTSLWILLSLVPSTCPFFYTFFNNSPFQSFIFNFFFSVFRCFASPFYFLKYIFLLHPSHHAVHILFVCLEEL
jgi:hypothetical protein